ncbi:MAG: hypothetical protein OXC40_03910, partial [Proteobacteria bacterium]|nr:hypothetical protein [Pseudomonadota bacterium]
KEKAEADKNFQKWKEQNEKDEIEADKNFQQLKEQNEKDKAEADKNFQQLKEENEKSLKQLKEQNEKSLKQLKEKNEKDKIEADKNFQQWKEQNEKDKAEGEKNLQKLKEENEKSLQQWKEQNEKDKMVVKKKIDQAKSESGRMWGNILEDIVIDGLPVFCDAFELDFTSLVRNFRYRDQDENMICEYDFAISYDIRNLDMPRYLVGEVKSTLTSNNIKEFVDKLQLFSKAIGSYSPIEVVGAIVYGKTDDQPSQKKKKSILVDREEQADLDRRIKQAEKAGLIVIKAFGGNEFSLSKSMNTLDFQPKIFQLSKGADPKGTDNTKK